MKRSRIRQLPESGYGPLYFRQALRVSGRIDGRAYRGRVSMDYSLANGPTYCFYRNQALYVPAAGFASRCGNCARCRRPSPTSAPGSLGSRFVPALDGSAIGRQSHPETVVHVPPGAVARGKYPPPITLHPAAKPVPPSGN